MTPEQTRYREAAPTTPGWYECRDYKWNHDTRGVMWFDGVDKMCLTKLGLAPQPVSDYTDFLGPLVPAGEELRRAAASEPQPERRPDAAV